MNSDSTDEENCSDLLKTVRKKMTSEDKKTDVNLDTSNCAPEYFVQGLWRVLHICSY